MTKSKQKKSPIFDKIQTNNLLKCDKIQTYNMNLPHKARLFCWQKISKSHFLRLITFAQPTLTVRPIFCGVMLMLLQIFL